MKKRLKIQIFILLAALTLPLAAFSQNCSNFIRYQNPQFPYKYNGQSKSATCESGKTYKFVVTFYEGRDYKISFYASSIFNNKIQFRIIDEGDNKTLVDLPGNPPTPDGKGVLVAPVFIDKEGEYPSFPFHVLSTQKLRIELDIEANPEEVKRGCVGVLIQDKSTEDVGF